MKILAAQLLYLKVRLADLRRNWQKMNRIIEILITI